MPEEIGDVIVACIVSAGGIGGIIIAAVKFSSEIIAKRLDEKYTLKINRALETHKGKLDNRIHISRAMFDKEFEIYQTLCSAFYEAYSRYEILQGLMNSDKAIIPKSEIRLDNPKLFDLYNDIQNGNAVTEIDIDQLKNELSEKLLDFRKLLYKSGAFIPHDNQKLFIDLLNELSICVKKNSICSSDKLHLLRGKMQVELRSYLENLSVIE